MDFTIKNEHYSITVAKLGAELVSLKSASGFEYIWQNGTGEFWNSHAPILFPACGRMKDQKYTYGGVEYPIDVHGFLNKTEFAVASKEGSHLTLTFTATEETKKIYPFDFTVIADYELAGDELIFSFTVKNTGKEPLPYMFGWHPGFNLPTSDALDIESYAVDMGEDVKAVRWFALQNGPFVNPNSTEYALSDGKYRLCEEEIYKNDTMIFTGHKNAVKLYAEGEPYELDFSWSDNLPYLCIWKDDTNAAKYICLEPWSDVPADGVCDENFDTRKMARLAPSESEVYTYRIKAKC